PTWLYPYFTNRGLVLPMLAPSKALLFRDVLLGACRFALRLPPPTIAPPFEPLAEQPYINDNANSGIKNKIIRFIKITSAF
ncbi:MAG: hypothetical protein K2N67_02735, partial [Mucispirillum sp.]|nr:hypothetical protein [Mucispirillum sp.]